MISIPPLEKNVGSKDRFPASRPFAFLTSVEKLGSAKTIRTYPEIEHNPIQTRTFGKPRIQNVHAERDNQHWRVCRNDRRKGARSRKAFPGINCIGKHRLHSFLRSRKYKP